ncbi:MAG: hypothetical protein R2770_05160 [Acidimicrobiales bacterium]|nr:hypothetical protein [Acidimicrobiales bacterium]
MPAGQLAFHDGVLVTTPSRTLVDIAAVVHRDRLARLLDWGWNRRQLTGHTVLGCLAQIGSRGRHGVAALRELIEERGQHYSPPATGLESRAAAVLRRHGYCGAVSQVNVGGRVWLGRVDLLVGSRVVVEVQSDLFHSSLTSREDDKARFDALGEAGFEVVEVWESDLWQGDAWVVRVARALAGTNRVVPAPR